MNVIDPTFAKTIPAPGGHQLTVEIAHTHVYVEGRLTRGTRTYRIETYLAPDDAGGWKLAGWPMVRWLYANGSERHVKKAEADEVLITAMWLVSQHVKPTDLHSGDLTQIQAELDAVEAEQARLSAEIGRLAAEDRMANRRWTRLRADVRRLTENEESE